MYARLSVSFKNSTLFNSRNQECPSFSLLTNLILHLFLNVFSKLRINKKRLKFSRPHQATTHKWLIGCDGSADEIATFASIDILVEFYYKGLLGSKLEYELCHGVSYFIRTHWWWIMFQFNFNRIMFGSFELCSEACTYNRILLNRFKIVRVLRIMFGMFSF